MNYKLIWSYPESSFVSRADSNQGHSNDRSYASNSS